MYKRQVLVVICFVFSQRGFRQAGLLRQLFQRQVCLLYTSPSLSQAQRLKKFSQEGRLSEDIMRAILSEEKKPEVGKITLSSDCLLYTSPAHHKRFPMLGNHCDFPPFLTFEIFEFVNVVNLVMVALCRSA